MNKATRAYLAVQSAHETTSRIHVNVVKRDDPLRDGKSYAEVESARLRAFVAELRATALHKLKTLPLPTTDRVD